MRYPQPALTLLCPSGGCLLCGIASVSRSALEVARRGGQQATAAAVWRPVVTSRTALGLIGPDRIQGHVCPSCDDAIDNAGAIGQSAIGSALLAHLRCQRGGESQARRLETVLTGDFPPTLRAWAVTGRAPALAPWSHMSRLLEGI